MSISELFAPLSVKKGNCNIRILRCGRNRCCLLVDSASRPPCLSYCSSPGTPSCSVSAGGLSARLFTSHLSTIYLGLQTTRPSQVSHLNHMTNATDLCLTREHPSNVPPTRRVGLRGESRRARTSIHHSRILRGMAEIAHTFHSSLNADRLHPDQVAVYVRPAGVARYIREGSRCIRGERDIHLVRSCYIRVALTSTDMFTVYSGSASVLGCFPRWVSLSCLIGPFCRNCRNRY